MDGFLLTGFMLFAALFFVALNGVFVLAEFSFATIRTTQVERLVQEGRTSAGLVREATRKLDASLAVCQLGITISSLSLGALGEPAIADLIEPAFEAAGMPEGLVHPIAFGIGFFIITSLHVVLGELVPKSIGIQRPEGASLAIAPLMRGFHYLFLPLMLAFNGTGNAIVRAFGIPPASETEDNHSEEEVRMIIAQSTRQGALQESDEQMLEGIFELGQTAVKEVMTPRPDVVTLPAQTPLSELARIIATGSHTRYPLYEEADTEHIVGVVHARDVLRAAEEAQSFQSQMTARELMREFVTVTENRLLEGVLTEFRRRKVHLAVVIDEWGSFEGIVTLEDVLEEIVGDIDDEFDEEAPVTLDSAEDLKIASMSVHNGSRTRFEDETGRRETLLPGTEINETLPTGDQAIAARVEALLDEGPGGEVELVLDARGRALAPDTGKSTQDSALADRARNRLLALLTERGLSVAVCCDTLRVWRPGGGSRLWRIQTNGGTLYARGRR